MNSSIVICIPIYKEELNVFEKVSLSQLDKVLQKYPKVYIAPESLMFDYGIDYSVMRFPDKFFKSTETYSELLMCKQFYDVFDRYKYLLVYQLDCFVFNDSLKRFCDMGYDYMGAPTKGKEWNISYFENGGLSLRNIIKCSSLLEQKERITKKIYRATNVDKIPEDVFFSYCGIDSEINFSMPSPKVAARFSVHTDYARAMRDINKNGLPFGCHYWWRADYDFWKPYVERYGYELPELSTYSTLRSDAIKRSMYLTQRYIRKQIKNGNMTGILNKLPTDKPYSVYGGGLYGKRCVKMLKMLSLKISVIYDKSTDKREICGVPVVKPCENEIKYSSSYIIVGTLKYEEEISKLLLRKGMKKNVDFFSIYNFCKMINNSIKIIIK